MKKLLCRFKKKFEMTLLDLIVSAGKKILFDNLTHRKNRVTFNNNKIYIFIIHIQLFFDTCE